MRLRGGAGNFRRILFGDRARAWNIERRPHHALPGQSEAEEFSTLAHELAHELLHRGDRRGATSCRIRETEAEATAFVVCHAIGLETGSAATDYIQLWNGDAQLLTESLGHVRQAASQMLTTLTDG